MNIIKKYIDFLIDSKTIQFQAGRKQVLFNYEAKAISFVQKTISEYNFVFESGFENTSDLAKDIASNSPSVKSKINKELCTRHNSFLESCIEPSKTQIFLKQNALIPFVDSETADVVLWDKDRNKLAETTFRAFKVIHGSKVISAMQEAGHFKIARLEYDPVNIETHSSVSVDGVKTVKLNTYKPPKWRLEETKAALPCEFDSFFKFLFPQEKERSVIFTFLKHMILFRVSHILVLIGRKGIGKNILVEEILKPLVGREYFAKPAKNFFKGAFQDVLENNRLLFIDEIKATTDEAKKDLKRLPNAWQGIEKKKQDTKQQKIFYSVVIANNALDDIYIEYDDRRFFFPELTEARLQDLGQEVIDNYLLAFRKQGNIAAFGNWLIQRADDLDFSVENAYITDTFHKAVEASLREWQAFMVKTILEAKTLYLDWKEIKKKNIKENGKDSDRYFKPKRVQEFLENYLHEGKYPLGAWVKYEGKQAIKVNTDLVTIPEESKATDVDTLIDSL